MFYDLNKEKNICNKLNTEKKDLEDLEMFKKPDEKIWFTPKKILQMSNMFVMDFNEKKIKSEKKKNLDDINNIMMNNQEFQFCERIFDKLVGRKKN